jgi:hypothetical protein
VREGTVTVGDAVGVGAMAVGAAQPARMRLRTMRWSERESLGMVMDLHLFSRRRIAFPPRPVAARSRLRRPKKDLGSR